MMMAASWAKYSGSKIPLHSEFRVRGVQAATTSTFKISFSNICGINSNLNSVHHYLQSNKPQALFLTETQISAKTSTNHLNFPGYELLTSFRLHRGVCAYVRSNLPCTRLPKLETGQKDILWLKICLKTSTKFICCIYRSPSDSNFVQLFDSISEKIDHLISEHPSSEVIILGDFNVHNKEWLGSSKTDPQGRAAADFATSNALTNLVQQPTYFPRISTHSSNPLDLFLTTNPESYKILVTTPLGNSDHAIITASCPMQPDTSEAPQPHIVWHYNSAEWEDFRDYISFQLRDIFSSLSDPSDISQKITEVILSGMEYYIPYTKKTSATTQKPWFSKSCDKARLEKVNAHRTFLQSPSQENRQAFNDARNRYNRILSETKNSFNDRIKNKVLSGSNGSKHFWTLAKSIGQNFCKSTFPPLISGEEIISTAQGKAELFASQFAENSTLNPPPNAQLPSIPRVAHTMSDIIFKTKKVQKILSSLNIRKASGPDGIPAIVLKKCAPELAPVLARLFQISYNRGIFPSHWKTARIQPVPKKGSKAFPSNYRPISLLSTISKVMEKYMNIELLKYLEKHNLIHDRQYGFRHRRSTADLLSFVSHSWDKSIEFYGESQIVALDISKAFDQVWHAALLNKLPSYGLPLKLCTWTTSFLSNRSISVVVDGHCSKLHQINAGVPQGSVLAPTLFLLYINDLLSSTSNPIHSYADDSTLHSNIQYTKPVSLAKLDNDRRTMQASISHDLQKISDWGTKNCVQFNSSKSQSCILSHKKHTNACPITMNNQVVQSKESFSLVGISVDQNLNWHPHITSVAEAAAKKLSFLFRCRKYFSSANLFTLYISLIRPCLEYCSHIWGAAAASTLAILDSIQRRAIRLINDPALTQKLPSLAHRRAVGDLSLFYRYYHGLCSDELSSIVPPPAVPNRSTRGTDRMHPFTVEFTKFRTLCYSRSFIPRTSKLWNTLPAHVFPSPPSLQTFKTRINKLPLSSLSAPTVLST